MEKEIKNLKGKVISRCLEEEDISYTFEFTDGSKAIVWVHGDQMAILEEDCPQPYWRSINGVYHVYQPPLLDPVYQTIDVMEASLCVAQLKLEKMHK